LHIDGYELTEEFAKKARDILKMHGLDENVSIRQADLLTIQLPRDAYDGFYSSRVIHYIEEKELVTRKLFECLKPGGRGVFIIPNSKCPYRWLSYRHAPLYPIHKLADLMQKVGFRDISQGGYGFLPAKLRISHDSYFCTLDKILSRTPMGRFAGLAYVVGSR
jgi:SAM-dependent methyltransferase